MSKITGTRPQTTTAAPKAAAQAKTEPKKAEAKGWGARTGNSEAGGATKPAAPKATTTPKRAGGTEAGGTAKPAGWAPPAAPRTRVGGRE